jgi:hypothetical protein
MHPVAQLEARDADILGRCVASVCGIMLGEYRANVNAHRSRSSAPSGVAQLLGEGGRLLVGGWRTLLGFANDCQTVGAAHCAVFAGCAFRMTAIKFVFVPVSLGTELSRLLTCNA